MMPLISILCFAALLSAASKGADAFVFGRPPVAGADLASRPSTCLFAEEETPSEEVEAATSSSEKTATTGNDILNSPAFLKRKLDVLQSDIAKAEEDIEAAKQRLEEGKAEWGSQLDELAKEYANIQDRMNTQSKQGDTMATVQVARKMLEVLDNYDRAFGAITAETEADKTIEAEYRKTYDGILEVFEKLGIEEVKTVGTEFDYEVHQAVMQRPSDGFDEGIVCEELQKGFKLGNTLIRAAMVSVAA